MRGSSGSSRGARWFAVALALSACTPDSDDIGSAVGAPVDVEVASDGVDPTVPTDDGSGEADDPGPRPSLPNEASAAVVRQQRRHVLPDPLGDLQRQFGVAPVILPLGEVTTTDLGIEVTFDLRRWWRLEHAAPAEITLAPPDNPIGRLRPNIVLIRPTGFADPLLAPYGTFHPGGETLPPDGLAAWIDALPQVVLVDRTTFQVDGRTVVRHDVDLDTELGPTNDACRPGSCVDLLWNGASNFFVLRDEEDVRYYEIEDPSGPIIVLVAADTGNEAFLEIADAFVRSLEIGPSAPHPIPPDVRWANYSVGEAGTYRPVAIEGLLLRRDGFHFVEQRPGQVLTGSTVAGTPALVAAPVAAGDGRAIASPDAVVQVLVEDEDWITSEGDDVAWVDADGVERSGLQVEVRSRSRDADRTPPLLLAPLEPGDDPLLAGFPEPGAYRFLVTTLGPEGGERLVVIGDVDPDGERSLERILDLGRDLSLGSPPGDEPATGAGDG